MTVQFHVRDAGSADQDLRESLARAQDGGTAVAALLFTANGRGGRLFDDPDHDAALASGVLRRLPMAADFAVGEHSPVGGTNHVHGLTAPLAVLEDG